MKFVDWFKEKCTWLNFCHVLAIGNLLYFAYLAVYAAVSFNYGEVPPEYHQEMFEYMMYAFVFSVFRDNYKRKVEHNEFIEEITFTIFDMRNEIEQLKQNKESKE